MLCNGNVKVVDELLGECDKCGIMSKRSKCQKLTTAHVTVTKEDRRYTLRLFNDVW